MRLKLLPSISALLCASVLLANAEVEYTVVLSSTSAVPGFPTSQRAQGFSAPSSDDEGGVAFKAQLVLSGTVTSLNDDILLSTGTAGLELTAREGQPAPANVPANFDLFGEATTYTLGGVAFSARLHGESVTRNNREGIWNNLGETGDGLQAVALAGSPAPETLGSWLAFRDVRASGSDTTAWIGHLLRAGGIGRGNDSGIWVNSDTETVLAKSGTKLMLEGAVPIGHTVGKLADLGGADLRVNSNGDVAITSDMIFKDKRYRMIWRGPAEDLELLVGEGHEPAPVLGELFKDLGPATINGEGDVAFRGKAGKAEAIFVEGEEGLEVVAESSNEEEDFKGFGDPVLNDSGEVAFIGYFAKEKKDPEIWKGTAGDLDIVATYDDDALGEDDAVFESFEELAINSDGNVAFIANLTGPGVSNKKGNNVGLYAESPDGELNLVARCGEEIDGKVVARIDFNGGHGEDDGLPHGWLEDSRIVFTVEFTDGTSAVMLATVTDI